MTHIHSIRTINYKSINEITLLHERLHDEEKSLFRDLYYMLLISPSYLPLPPKKRGKYNNFSLEIVFLSYYSFF